MSSHRYLPYSLLALIFLSTSRLRLATALEVTVNSPCSNFCIDSPTGNISDPIASATFTKDLSCLDSDYNGANSTSIGRKFRQCVSCEQTSDATGIGQPGEGNENDLYWFLYNMKSTIGWCVHGFFETQQNPNTTLAMSMCAADCDPISTALEDRLLQTNLTLQYNYCESDNGAFVKGVDTCAKCLNNAPNLQIMGNFLAALNAACTQRPIHGAVLDFATNVFSLPSSTASPTASTASPIPSSSSLSSTTPSDPSAISTGAKAGIAIAVVAGVALIGSAIFFLLGRRRKFTELKGHELEGNVGAAIGVEGSYMGAGRGGGSGGGDVKYYRHTRTATEMQAERPPVELPGSGAWGK